MWPLAPADLQRTRDLMRTPLAVEVLDDLAHGRPPFARLDFETVYRAIWCLASVGAAVIYHSPDPNLPPHATLTDAGRTLHQRFVDITRSAVVDDPDTPANRAVQPSTTPERYPADLP